MNLIIKLYFFVYLNSKYLSKIILCSFILLDLKKNNNRVKTFNFEKNIYSNY